MEDRLLERGALRSILGEPDIEDHCFGFWRMVWGPVAVWSPVEGTPPTDTWLWMLPGKKPGRSNARRGVFRDLLKDCERIRAEK